LKENKDVQITVTKKEKTSVDGHCTPKGSIKHLQGSWNQASSHSTPLDTRKITSDKNHLTNIFAFNLGSIKEA